MECVGIELTRGKTTWIDAEDYDSLSQYKWYCSHYGYAVRGITRDRKVAIVFMHRSIMNPPEGMEIDHIDGDRLNNRRSNLRIVTKTENIRNSKARDGCSSRHKGVNWLATNRKWRARIRVDGRDIPLGCYVTEEDAARAYNRAALEHFGEYARLNTI